MILDLHLDKIQPDEGGSSAAQLTLKQEMEVNLSLILADGA